MCDAVIGTLPSSSRRSMPSWRARWRTAGEASGRAAGRAWRFVRVQRACGWGRGCSGVSRRRSRRTCRTDAGRSAGPAGCHGRHIGRNSGAGGDGAGGGVAGASAILSCLPVPPVPASSRAPCRSGSAPTRPPSPGRPRRRAPARCRRPATGSRPSPCRSSRRRATWSSATRSPGLTCHATSLGFGDAFADVGHLDHVDAHAPPSPARSAAPDALRAGEVVPLQRVRIGRVPAGDALDRRFEVIEAVLLHQRDEFGAEAAGARRLVHDDAAAGLLHRVRRSCRRRAAAGVRRSMISASMPVSSAAASRDVHHRAVGEHGDVLARAHDRRLAERHRVVALGHLAQRVRRPRHRRAGRGGRRTGRCRGAWARGR